MGGNEHYRDIVGSGLPIGGIMAVLGGLSSAFDTFSLGRSLFEADISPLEMLADYMPTWLCHAV